LVLLHFIPLVFCSDSNRQDEYSFKISAKTVGLKGKFYTAS